MGERLVAALELSGLTVLVESDLRDRPLLLTVRHGGLTQRLRIFLWNATPGGPPGVRAATEFRVQTTRPGDQPLLADETRTTLLLGYHEDLDVFAAWDARVHPNPGSSSSLQVPLEALEEAASDGFASRLRAITDAEEVVVTFSPENVATYVEILGPFQAVVEEPDDSPLGQTVTSGKEPPETDLPGDEERRYAARTVVAAVRDSRFRSRVVKAYDGRCAFCGLDLGLVDAAHIQSVHDAGPDTVANGLCACPTHHRALDRGILLIADDFTISVNRPRLEELGLSEADVAPLEEGLLSVLAVPSSTPPGTEFLAFHREKWSRPS